MFFAGAESKKTQQLLKQAGAKRVLLSYYYIKHRNVDIKEIMNSFDEILIDSGAFTFLASNKSHDNMMGMFNKFLDEYLDFLWTYRGAFNWVANFDIDSIVGHKKVQEWNKEFQKLEEKGGQTVCYVAHDNIGDASKFLPNTVEYLRKYNYVGASGITDKISTAFYERFYILAQKYQTRTHGFGLTAFVSFDRFPCFTCDSTTYLGGAKFGTTYVWNGSFFETWDYTKKYRRKTLKHWCELWGIDHEKFCIDDIDEVTKFNINSWLENEKAFNAKTSSRQWWSSEKLPFPKKY